jgi:hypothetical protein
MADIRTDPSFPSPARRPPVVATREDHPLMRSTPRRPAPPDRREARYEATALVSRRQVERRLQADKRSRTPDRLVGLLLVASALLAVTFAGLLVLDRLQPGLIARVRDRIVASAVSAL